MAELVPDIHWSWRTGTLIVGHDDHDDNNDGSNENNFIKTNLRIHNMNPVIGIPQSNW